MEHDTNTNRPGTPPEPAADGLREINRRLYDLADTLGDGHAAQEAESIARAVSRLSGGQADTMEAAADAYEAKLAETEAQVAAAPIKDLVCLIHEAGGTLDEHAADCCEEDRRWYYVAEASAVWRAEDIIRKVDAALASLADQEEWDAGTLSDFADELRAILKGGAL